MLPTLVVLGSGYLEMRQALGPDPRTERQVQRGWICLFLWNFYKGRWWWQTPVGSFQPKGTCLCPGPIELSSSERNMKRAGPLSCLRGVWLRCELLKSDTRVHGQVLGRNGCHCATLNRSWRAGSFPEGAPQTSFFLLWGLPGRVSGLCLERAVEQSWGLETSKQGWLFRDELEGF